MPARHVLALVVLASAGTAQAQADLNVITAVGLKDWSGVSFPATMAMTVIAGLLVGAGTTLGSGCTSGHGICGLARFSMRSIVATATFMVTGAATVFIIRHIV